MLSEDQCKDDQDEPNDDNYAQTDQKRCQDLHYGQGDQTDEGQDPQDATKDCSDVD